MNYLEFKLLLQEAEHLADLADMNVDACTIFISVGSDASPVAVTLKQINEVRVPRRAIKD